MEMAVQDRPAGMRRSLGRMLSLAAVCVLAGAAPLAAEEAQPRVSPGTPVQTDISGRWEGRTYELSRTRSDCSGTVCKLTLDVGKCGAGWCGVEVVGAERRCGTTALKLDSGTKADAESTPVFKGNLTLAKGTEPYVVEVNLLVGPAAGEDGPQLQILGDTGGEFRMFRRSFPFSTTLAKVGDAVCRPESTLSMLQ